MRGKVLKKFLEAKNYKEKLINNGKNEINI